MALQLFSDFNPSSIQFSKVNSRKEVPGVKTVYVTDTKGGKIIFQLPQMRAFVGVSDFKVSGEVASYSLPLSLTDADTKAKFDVLDKMAHDFIVANSVAFFDEPITAEQLRLMKKFKPLVKFSKNKPEMPPALSLKLIWTKKTGKIDTECYNSDREKVDIMTSIAKGSIVSCIAELNSIWYGTTGCGLSLRLHQVMLAPVVKLPPCAFLAPASEPVVPVLPDEGEDDEEEFEDE